MADIQITQPHHLSNADARAAAQKIAEKMADEFDIVSEWQGNILAFTRSGVSGTLALLEREARLEITLGLMFKAFAATIESKLGASMQKVFRTPA